MSGCRQAVRLGLLAAHGGALSASQRAHVGECRHCREAIARAETFSILLGTAARSLVAEAAAGSPLPVPGAAVAGTWHGAVAIDSRAFEPLDRWSPPWAAFARLATLAATAAVLLLAVALLVPKLNGPASPRTLDAEAVVGRLVALGYDCRAVPPPVPAGGSGPSFTCVGRSPGPAAVTVDVHASTTGALSSLVASLPGSQTPDNRSTVQSIARQLAATPFDTAATANAATAWVDAFFAPATDPGATSIRIDGLVLRLGVDPARPYELDINPETPA